MKFAAIDLGTQTFRLGLARVKAPRTVESAGTFLYNARLGGCLSDGGLSPKVLSAIEEIRKRCLMEGPTRIKACGTEAVRIMKDRFQTSFSAMEEALGVPIRVLTPEEEGRLTALGVKTSLGLSSDPLLILDVGGGSTEAILYSLREVEVVSTPIGAVNFSKERLDSLSFLAMPPFSRAKTVVATGGTATTLAAMIKKLDTYRPWEIRAMVIERAGIESTIRELMALGLEERKRVPGLEPERADIIIPGLKILVHALQTKGASSITISDGGLLMGILVDLIKKEFKDHAQLDWRRLYV